MSLNYCNLQAISSFLRNRPGPCSSPIFRVNLRDPDVAGYLQTMTRRCQLNSAGTFTLVETVVKRTKIATLHPMLTVVLATTLLFLFPEHLWSQAGRVSGRVTDAETGAKLPGANVVVAATNIGTVADFDGEFSLLRVPAGGQTVRITYIGYEAAEVVVEVGAAAIALDVALTPAPLTADEVIVMGLRAKRQALALSQQKNAPNIVNVVAADLMGRFPDASAPDALQRIPGIHVERDQGEGRYIQIRGASPAMTSVTFNGERVPSPEGDVRQIALDAVPTEILEAIEVSKAVTPDMDADAIGGSVNLVTRRPPESRTVTLEATSGYGSIRQDASGKGTVTFGDRLVDGRLGLLLSATTSQRHFGSDNIEPEYDFGEPGLVDDKLEEFQVRHYTISRLRRGFTGLADYEVNKHTSLYLNTTLTELHDNEVRRRFRHKVGDGELAYEHKDRKEILRSYNFTVGGEHLFNNDASLDLHVTTSRSEEDTDKDIEIAFDRGDVVFSPDIGNTDEPQTNPAPGSLDGEFEFDSVEPSTSNTENTDFVAAVNYSMPVQFGQAAGSLKVGAKYRSKEKRQDVDENAFELLDDAESVFLGQGFGGGFDLGDFNPGSYSFPAAVPSRRDVTGFVDRFGDRLDSEHNVEADTEDFIAEETTIALYAMSEINLTGRVTILTGARLERTDVESTGNAFDGDVLTPTAGGNDYAKLFPMAHFRYRLTPATNLRASFTTALQRPNFFDLAPWRVVDDEDIQLGNPSLDPAHSVNVDLMAEHYFRPLGVASVGFFYKSISDPIVRFTSANELGGETVRPGNGQDATLSGLETAYQQQLSFLPGVLSRFGLYLNYTLTSSEAELADGRKADMPGQAQNVANAALSYEKGPLSAQLSLNHHDAFIVEYGDEIGNGEFEDEFVSAHTQLDLSVTYRILPQMSANLELVNLTNEPWVMYKSHEDRPIQREFYEAWGWLGLKYSL